jgi:phospholipid/cholesterol/gamma-HCH transport system permease protein
MERMGSVLADVSLVTRSPWRELFIRYFMLAGIDSVRNVLIRATLVGGVLIGYVVNVVAADAQSAIRLLVMVVLREGGPIFAALIVMARGGIEITGQLVRMRERGEGQGLQLLGVDPLELFGAPCLLGIAGATVILTIYFNLLAVAGGIVLASLIADLSVVELAERFFLQVQFADFFYAIGKSAMFGVAIGAVSCYYGLIAPIHRWRDGSSLVSRSVMLTLLLISLINAVAAYIAHGVVFFGAIHT